MEMTPKQHKGASWFWRLDLRSRFLLVIYCLKGTDVLGPTHAIPEIVALAVIYVLHRMKHNALLSIAGGTAVYVLLLRLLSAAA